MASHAHDAFACDNSGACFMARRAALKLSAWQICGGKYVAYSGSDRGKSNGEATNGVAISKLVAVALIS